MTIKATNDNTWVIRDVPETEKNGIQIPDSAKPKVHRGKIITVGKLVSDDTIKVGRVAIFNRSAGFEITEGNIEYTILRQLDIVGTDDSC
jgi:co-chaperonin GroES (HSP10)